jgi:hypothetical protein
VFADADSHIGGTSARVNTRPTKIEKLPYTSARGEPIQAKNSEERLAFEFNSIFTKKFTIGKNPRPVESTNVALGSTTFDTGFKRQVNEDLEDIRQKISKQQQMHYDLQRQFASIT